MRLLVRPLARWAWGEGDSARPLSTVLPAMAVIIMAGLLIVLGLIMAKSAREGAQNEAGGKLAIEAKTFSGLLDQSINAELADLESRANSIAALELHQTPEKLRAWLDGIQQKIPEYTWIGFADHKGVIRASSGGLLTGQSVSGRDWFEQGLLSPTTIDLHEAKLLAPYLPARTDGPWRFIDLATPLKNLQGDSLGVIGAHLSWDWLMALQKRFSAMLPLPQGAEVMVAGKDGQIRLTGLPSQNWPLGELKSFQQAASQPSGWVRETWPDGKDYFVGFAKSPGGIAGRELGWVTLIRIPAEAFEQAADHAATGIWALVVATIVLFYVGIRLVLRVALLPVRQLVSQVGEVAQHGGRVDLSAPAPRELRALGAATNQMIQAIEASQSADLAKSRFLADMSHEVRTLLHGMLSHLELSRINRDPVQKERDISKAMDYSRELIALVNDLLDLSAIEEGKLRLERTPTELATLVRSNALLYEGQARSKHLSFHLELCLDEAMQAVTDPLRLGQILRNLIANAVKFTSQGSVMVRAELEQDDRILCIRVRDTGKGLSQAQQEMIFGRFEQAHPLPCERFGGSGLGLSVSRALATAMGGEMTLKSEAGVGSEFIVRMPIEIPAAELQSRQHQLVSVQQRKLRVLCVDDLQDNRSVLCRWLSLHGHVAKEARSGAEAVQKAALNDFDLILMDIDLPDMQGTDAIGEIRSARGTSARATIYTVSGHAYDADIRRSLAAGSDGHITKPIDYRILEGMLGKISRLEGSG